MSETVVAKSDTFEQWRVKTNIIGQDVGALIQDVGDLTSLNTPATNLVEAVNNTTNDSIALVLALGG